MDSEQQMPTIKRGKTKAQRDKEESMKQSCIREREILRDWTRRNIYSRREEQLGALPNIIVGSPNKNAHSKDRS